MSSRRFIYQLASIMVLSLLFVTVLATSGFAVENDGRLLPSSSR